MVEEGEVERRIEVSGELRVGPGRHFVNEIPHACHAPSITLINLDHG